MGYRMEYGTGNNDAVYCRLGNKKISLWIIAAVASVFLLIGYFQRDKLVNMLLPGDPDATRKAIGVFVNEMKDGQNVVNAFADFCRVIVNEAELS